MPENQGFEPLTALCQYLDLACLRVNGVNYYSYWMSKHPGLVNFVKATGEWKLTQN